MKQTVNLLKDDLKPIIQRVSLTSTLVVAASLLMLMVVWAVVEQWQLSTQQQQQQQLQQTLEAAQQRQQQLQQQLQQRTASPELVQRAQNLEQEIAGQKSLNQQLTQRQGEQHQRPDQLMRELQSINVDGVWLTEFVLQNGAVSLTGKALRANLLPRWMQRFSSTELLSRSRFSVVGLDQNEQGQQLFRLTNQPNEADGGDNRQRPDEESQ